MTDLFNALVSGANHPRLNQLGMIMLSICIGMEIFCYLVWRFMPRWCWIVARIIATLLVVGWAVLCVWHVLAYAGVHEGSLRGTRGPKAIFAYGIAVGAVSVWTTISEFRGGRSEDE